MECNHHGTSQHTPVCSKSIRQQDVIGTATPVIPFTDFPLCALPGCYCVDQPPTPDVCCCVPSAAISFPVPAVSAPGNRERPGLGSGALSSHPSSANCLRESKRVAFSPTASVSSTVEWDQRLLGQTRQCVQILYTCEEFG